MDIVGRKLMLVNINTYLSLRAKCRLRGGVGGQFPRNIAVTYGLLKVPDITLLFLILLALP